MSIFLWAFDRKGQPLELSERRELLDVTVRTTQLELGTQTKERPVTGEYSDRESWLLAKLSSSKESANQRYARPITVTTDVMVFSTWPDNRLRTSSSESWFDSVFDSNSPIPPCVWSMWYTSERDSPSRAVEQFRAVSNFPEPIVFAFGENLNTYQCHSHRDSLNAEYYS